ncbi:MAG: hypothetical protein R3B72_51495 [Polyangiaceae bacterium]
MLHEGREQRRFGCAAGRGDDGDETVVLERHQGDTVPHGVVHRTRSPEPSTVLMIEKAGVVPRGD